MDNFRQRRSQCRPPRCKQLGISILWRDQSEPPALGRTMMTRIGFLFWMPLVYASAQNVGYVVDNALGQVKVIDLSLRKVTASIPTGQQPSEILILPNNRIAFVSNQTHNNVAVLDLSTNTRIATVPTGQAPGSIVSSP